MKGIDSYPVDLPLAYNMLVNYCGFKNGKNRVSIPFDVESEEEEEKISFVNMEDIICYRPGKKGHYTNECTTVLPDDSNDDPPNLPSAADKKKKTITLLCQGIKTADSDDGFHSTLVFTSIVIFNKMLLQLRTCTGSRRPGQQTLGAA